MAIATGEQATAADINALIPNLKAKLETRARNAASGDVAYTGYGFTPTGLIIIAVDGSNGSIGSSEPALAEQCLYEVGGVMSIETKIVYIDEGDAKRQHAVVKTYDADGFTLTWTRVGVTTAGTINLHVFAFR